MLLTATVSAGLSAILRGQVWAGSALVFGAGTYLALTALVPSIARAADQEDCPHHMALAVVDLLIITAIVWVTGGAHSEYYLLYYGPIVYAAVRLQVRDGIAAGVLAAALYVFVVIANPGGSLVITTAPLRVLGVLVSAAIMVVFFALLKREAHAYESLREYLHHSLRRVTAVYDVAHAANVGADLGAVFSILLSQAAHATGADRGVIALLEGDGQITVKAVFGPKPEGAEAPADWDPPLALEAIASRATVGPAEHRPVAGGATAAPGRFVYVPLLTPGGPIGVLALYSGSSRKLPRALAEFLETLCAEAATAVENVQLRAQLNRLASTDHLTGLANRREIEHHLALEADRASRYQRPLAVMMLDIDDLKHANDCYGHAVGDQVICALGRVLASRLRTSDRAGRVGGDEFLVVLPETSSEAAACAASRMIEEFRLELQSLRSWQEMKASLGLSVGIASGGNGLLRSGQLLARADQALYEAKRTGKNRACLSPTGQAQPLAVSSR